MKTTLAYRPASSGHDGEPKRRKGYIKPEDRLFDAFEKWINSASVYKCSKGRASTMVDKTNHMEESYKMALAMMPELESVTQGDINSVFLPFTDHPNVEHSGIFISAAHMKSGSKEIMFDTKSIVPIARLGYMFGKDRTLLVREDAGYFVGDEGNGTYVNYGSTHSMGNHESSGLFINVGDLEEAMGGGQEDSLAINLGSCSCYWHGTFLVKDDYKGDDVVNYFDHNGNREDRVYGIGHFLEWVAKGVDPEKTDEEIFQFLRKNDLRQKLKNLREAYAKHSRL